MCQNIRIKPAVNIVCRRREKEREENEKSFLLELLKSMGSVVFEIVDIDTG